MRRFIAQAAPALLALFAVSLLLPVSEAEARFRRRGGGGCGCSSGCGGGGCDTGCSTCNVGGSTSNYRGPMDNSQAPTPAQSNMTYGSDQAAPPPAPNYQGGSSTQGYNQNRGSNSASPQSNSDAAPRLPSR